MRGTRVRWQILMGAFLLTAACGSEPRTADTPAALPPPRPKTVEQRIARYQECWDHFNKQAWDPFKACYVEAAQAEAGAVPNGSGTAPAPAGFDPALSDDSDPADPSPTAG